MNMKMNLDELTEFARTNPDEVNWYWISQYQKLSEEFIIEMQIKGYL